MNTPGSGASNEPAVTVCGALSLLNQLTIVPTPTSRSSNEKFSIFEEIIVALAASASGVGDGGGGVDVAGMEVAVGTGLDVASWTTATGSAVAVGSAVADAAGSVVAVGSADVGPALVPGVFVGSAVDAVTGAIGAAGAGGTGTTTAGAGGGATEACS